MPRTSVVSAAVDAFGRQRVSTPDTLFDSKLLHDKVPLLWDEQVTNVSGNATSTHVPADALVEMYVEAGDTVIRQSKMRQNYQPGKSQQVLCTGVLGAGADGVVSRIGTFDADDGLFFQLDGAAPSVVIRKGGVDTVVPQSEWNIDRFDGDGTSHVAVDFSRAQILVVDYEWLGVGTVRFGFGFQNQVLYCHQIDHANEVEAPYMSTPNLPIRYEVASTSAAATLKQICSTVMSEGGLQRQGVVRSVSTAGVGIAAGVAQTIYAIAGVRHRVGREDIVIRDEAIAVMNEGAQDFEWLVLLNPTVAGTFDFEAVPDSAVETAIGVAANTVTAGSWDLLIASGWVKSGNQGGSTVTTDVLNAVRLGATIGGVRDEIVLAVRPLANNAVIQASLSFRELF